MRVTHQWETKVQIYIKSAGGQDLVDLPAQHSDQPADNIRCTRRYIPFCKTNRQSPLLVIGAVPRHADIQQ